MHTLVTGSSGFIGSALTETMRQHGISFRAISRFGSRSGSHSNSSASSSGETTGVEWPNGLSSIDLSAVGSIVHLAFRRVSQKSGFHVEENIRPIEILIERIKATNPSCLFIFVSTPAASSDPSTSTYNQLKAHQEELLRRSGIRYVILRPGLVFGPGGKGIFGKLSMLTARFPLLPVLRGSVENPIIIQPLYIADLTNAIVSIILNNAPDNATISLGLREIGFESLLKLIAIVQGKHLRTIGIPISLVIAGLALAERLIPKFPFTTSNAKGLSELQPFPSAEGFKALSIRPTPLIEGLRRSFGLANEAEHHENIDELDRELHLLHHSLFNKLPSPSLRERYFLAHQFCCKTTEADNLSLTQIEHSALDPNTIERGLRRPEGEQKHILTRKLLLISYLAETESSYLDSFYQRRSSLLQGYFQLACAVSRTVLSIIVARVSPRYRRCTTR